MLARVFVQVLFHSKWETIASCMPNCISACDDRAAAARRALEAERERLQQRLSDSARAAAPHGASPEESDARAHAQPLENGSAAAGLLQTLRQELRDLHAQLQASSRVLGCCLTCQCFARLASVIFNGTCIARPTTQPGWEISACRCSAAPSAPEATAGWHGHP